MRKFARLKARRRMKLAGVKHMNREKNKPLSPLRMKRHQSEIMTHRSYFAENWRQFAKARKVA